MRVTTSIMIRSSSSRPSLMSKQSNSSQPQIEHQIKKGLSEWLNDQSKEPKKSAQNSGVDANAEESKDDALKPETLLPKSERFTRPDVDMTEQELPDGKKSKFAI